jgi:NAD(P)-dependent dehydrogenase (short-subunit alcohol dehydrogenase family)
MNGKICLITGANSGIGRFSALGLAKQGAEIVMICRNKLKAEEAKNDIIAQSGNEKVSFFIADLSSLAQIKRVSDEILNKHNRIDVLLNNAGFIAGSKRELTEDGFEVTFAVNHLSYFYLTHLLLDTIKNTPNSRVVNVSSLAHKFFKLNLDNLQLETGYRAAKAYCLSKLLNILFTKELAKRLKSTSTTTNCLHPGGVASNFASDTTPLFKFIFSLGKPFMISPEKGAETSIYLASNPEVANITGEYFAKKRIAKVSDEALNEQYQLKVWELSEKMCKI